MKPNPEINQTHIAEMEMKLREEKERYKHLKSESELAKFVACQEVDKYKRYYLNLKEEMDRLEEECNILRERQSKDQERIKDLLVEIERKESEFRDKFTELLLTECRDLECDKGRETDGVGEWKKKCEEEIVRKDEEIKELFVENRELACAMNKYEKLLIRELRIKEKKQEGFERNVRRKLFKGEEGSSSAMPVTNTDEETPKKNGGSLQVSHGENFPMTPEQRSKRMVVFDIGNEVDCDGVDADKDDRITLREVKRRILTELPDTRKVYVSRGAHKSGVRRTCKVSQVPDEQLLFLPRNKTQVVGSTELQHRSGKRYAKSFPSSELQSRALKRAKILQSNLKSHPSFIKSMVRSHVSGCCWLGLPHEFCKKNLSSYKVEMVLEDENGLKCNVIYLGYKNGVSGGWRGFASAHQLEIGDALIFELCEPRKFKVYIIKANLESSEEDFDDKISEENVAGTSQLGTAIQWIAQEEDPSVPQN